MMDLISNTIRQQKILIVSIGMCVALWSGIIGEYSHISGIANPTLSYGFLKSIASVMPFIVATMAVVLIIYRIEDGTRIKVLLLGPLGFATIYGFVGIISALNSPDTSIAIYWAASYISVPIVLWAVALMGVTANQLRLIISFIKAVFGVAVVVLLAFGLIKLNFWNLLTSPTDWLKCAPQSWYVESSHLIRETGVGRYAAVAAIFSISALWQRSWRFFWVFCVHLLSCNLNID